jgi:hypothetical protein
MKRLNLVQCVIITVTLSIATNIVWFVAREVLDDQPFEWPSIELPLTV